MVDWNHHFNSRTRYGFRVSGNTGDIIQRYLYLFGVWEPQLSSLIPDLLSEGDVFVDVGSNIGYFTLLGSKSVGKSGKVVSIEASAPVALLLADNIRINRCSNVRVIETAVHSDDRFVTLFAPRVGNLGAASTTAPKGPNAGEDRVRARPLSSILTRDEAQRVRAIKIDIEGAEMDALLGLLPILGIRKGPLAVVVEVSPAMLRQAGHSAAEVFNLMDKEGFSCYRLKNSYVASSYLQPVASPVLHDGSSVTEQADFLFTRGPVLPVDK